MVAIHHRGVRSLLYWRILVLIVGKKVDMHGGIPFGPSMLLGIWLGIFVGAPIATLYLQVTGLA